MRNSNQFAASGLAWFAILVFAITSFSTALPCCAQSESDGLRFPYQGLVLSDQATVHSGPGDVHYATQRLSQGDVVEVYRHDPGGWCAIRPTSSSFSLIPEAALEFVSDGVGRIAEEGTQAWVGTKLGPVEKPLWQIKLKKGELVEVLGEASWPSPEGHSTVWYQISPPAGEFRWIRISDIQLPASARLQLAANKQDSTGQDLESPAQTVRSLNDIIATSPTRVPAGTLSTDSNVVNSAIGFQQHQTQPGHVQQTGLQTDFSQPTQDATVSMNGGWRKSTRPIGSRGSLEQNKSPFGNSSSKYSGSRNYDSDHNPGSYSNAYETPPALRVANADIATPNLARELNSARDSFQSSFGSASGRTLSARMSDLEMQLTKEMLKDPSQWRLEDLETEATAVYRSSSDTSERALAEKFLKKVGNCKAVQTGYQSGSTSRGIGSQPIGSGVNHNVELSTTYDAHGWLNRMVRDGGKSDSSYVLQDDTGKITHHIAPTPGMNLTRYVKKRVGIIGQRGYHKELELDHVTAHRIIELEKTR